MTPLRDTGSALTPVGFLVGAHHAASGIGFTLRHRRLLLLSLLPMLVQAVLFCGLLFYGLRWVEGAVAPLRPEPGHWYSFLGALAWLIGAALVSLLAVLLSLFFTSVLCDPLYDLLSEATESLLLGRDVATKSTLASIASGILRELTALPWTLGVYALVAVPLWLLSLTGVGAAIALPLTLAWTWMFVALSGMSRSLGRHAVPGRRRLTIVFGTPAAALGFGCVGWAISHVPLTYPFLVVGGTRLHLALAAHGRVESSLSEEDRRTLRGTGET
jgi:uncharacterized protein involved in cysteine biosynthesis